MMTSNNGGGLPSSTSSKGFLLSHTTAASTILTGPKKKAPTGNEMILATSEEAPGGILILETGQSENGAPSQSIMHPPLMGRFKISDLAIFQLLKAFKLQQYAIVRYLKKLTNIIFSEID